MTTPQSYKVELIAYDTNKRTTLCKPVKVLTYHTRAQTETAAEFELERQYRGRYVVNRIKKNK